MFRRFSRDQLFSVLNLYNITEKFLAFCIILLNAFIISSIQEAKFCWNISATGFMKKVMPNHSLTCASHYSSVINDRWCGKLMAKKIFGWVILNPKTYFKCRWSRWWTSAKLLMFYSGTSKLLHLYKAFSVRSLGTGNCPWCALRDDKTFLKNSKFFLRHHLPNDLSIPPWKRSKKNWRQWKKIKYKTEKRKLKMIHLLVTHWKAHFVSVKEPKKHWKYVKVTETMVDRQGLEPKRRLN